MLRRQHSTQAQGLETWRRLYTQKVLDTSRYTQCRIPFKTPQFNEQKFEESFATWEFEIARYERDSQAPIPDNIKVAVLLNETKGALQQYLQLRAGTIQRYADVRELILEHHRARTAFFKMQAQQQALNTSTGSTDPQPMDIGLMYKAKRKHKGRGKSYKGQGKGTPQWHNKGKGYTGQHNSGYGPVKENHRHQLATAMLSKDQDTQPSKERQKGKEPPT